MSTMNETMSDEALFIPSDDTESTESVSKYPPSLTEGNYLGHIVDASTITREFTCSNPEEGQPLFFSLSYLGDEFIGENSSVDTLLGVANLLEGIANVIGNKLGWFSTNSRLKYKCFLYSGSNSVSSLPSIKITLLSG